MTRLGTSIVDFFADIISEDNSFYVKNDFDFASEKTIQIGNQNVSNEIVLENKLISDYTASKSNRVVLIDDISGNFNSQEGTIRYSQIGEFKIDEERASKFYILISDTRFEAEKEFIQVNLLHDDQYVYLVPYSRIETQLDLGRFDFFNDSVVFYPEKYEFNNYEISSLKLSFYKESNISGIGSTSIGDAFAITSSSIGISSSTSGPSTVVGFATTAFSSSKFLVETHETNPAGDTRYQFNEIIVIHDGSNVEFLDYAEIVSTGNPLTKPVSGIGTFGVDINVGIGVSLLFTPEVGVGVTIKVHQVSFDKTKTGIGSISIGGLSKISSDYTNITSSPSPGITTVSGFTTSLYDAAEYLVEIHDLTNNVYQSQQISMLQYNGEVYFSEYALISTGSFIGTFGASYNDGFVSLQYTPPISTDVEVKVFQYSLGLSSDQTGTVQFVENEYQDSLDSYFGTKIDTQRTFNLTNNSTPLFKKIFDASDSNIVNLDNDYILIPDHLFNTGEKVIYNSIGTGTTSSIGIGTTTVPGIGSTDKLPTDVYIIKLSENKIKLASTAENALAEFPVSFDLTSVGIGTSHSFASSGFLNSRALISIDNLIQRPLVATSTTSILDTDLGTGNALISAVGVSSFFSGDIIKIDDEYMRVESTRVGGPSEVLVNRGWLNSGIQTHSSGSLITKHIGDYNIVFDQISFIDAPYGLTGPVGLQTSSTFNGRVFNRTGVVGSSVTTYNDNYIFDTIENQFTGITSSFILKVNGSDVVGIETNTGIVLINNVFQNTNDENYLLKETSGITSISFSSAAGIAVTSDVNTSLLPRGGIIVSVGETGSFGYQPLISAGGTAIVAVDGTISSVAIGNSGSGYRSGIQTSVFIKATTTTGVTTIGYGLVSAGFVTSVVITNPGSGYTYSNPPTLSFEKPLNYENLPLTGSATGIGASVSVVVGQGKSVIDFKITNYGFKYSVGDELTIVGVPTDATAGSSFRPFKLNVVETFNDTFSGWTFGRLVKFDSFDDKFDGTKTIFDLTRTIGSVENKVLLKSDNPLIEIDNNLLVFINDILQIPKESYTSNKSSITFTEPPKQGDKIRIYFYDGSDADLNVVEVRNTIKVGDKVTINKYPENGYGDTFQQVPRTVVAITTSDTVATNVYNYTGLTTDLTLKRPLVWKKQTEDLIIGGLEVSKNREELEYSIRPSGYVISNVGTSSTEIFLDYAFPLFNEVDDIGESNLSVLVIDQTEKTPAFGTCVVSAAGTISSIQISDGGSGYTSSPIVSIGVTSGIGTVYSGIGITQNTNATATATVSGGVVSEVVIDNPGAGYTQTNPPKVLISPESTSFERISSVNVTGDFGIITGISFTSIVGVAATGIHFDLFIPKDSTLRSGLSTSPITLSGIKTDYYFVVTDSNVGKGITSYGDATGTSVVGVGTSFIDCVYKAVKVSQVTANAYGVGSTTLLRVTVSVASTANISTGSSSFYGKYSWGRMTDFVRITPKSFTSRTNSGSVGIETGVLVVREKDLKNSY